MADDLMQEIGVRRVSSMILQILNPVNIATYPPAVSQECHFCKSRANILHVEIRARAQPGAFQEDLRIVFNLLSSCVKACQVQDYDGAVSAIWTFISRASNSE